MQENLSLTKLKSKIEQNKNGAGEFAIFEGIHSVKHALRFKAKPEYLITKDRAGLIKLSQKLCPDLSSNFYKSIEVEKFDQLSDSKVRTEVIGIFKKPSRQNDIKLAGRAVLLDDPRDLNNIGAVIRVCAAANIQNLILVGESNPWNSRAIRAAVGLQFAMNIIKLSPEEVLKLNIPLISFDERGTDLNTKLKKQIPKNAILVFGSERDGISDGIKLNSDLIVRLPMQKNVSSLNLATSVAAALYSLK